MFKPQMHHFLLFLLCGTITKPAFQQAEATITTLTQACNGICTGLAPVLCQSSCPVGNIDLGVCLLGLLQVHTGIIIDALTSWTPISIVLQAPNCLTFIVDIGVVTINLVVLLLGIIPISISFCVHIQLTIAVNVALATCVVTPIVVGTVSNLLITLGYTLALLGLTETNLINFAVAQLALVLCSGPSTAVILNNIVPLLAFCPTNCGL